MKTLSESLSFSDKREVARAIKIERHRDVNLRETLLAYCSDNDINVNDFEDSDFISAALIMEDIYKADEPYTDHFYFWIIPDEWSL